MVWGPTNLSPESCSISNYKRLGDCGLVSPPTDRRCNQIADNAKCHSRHWSLIFIKRLSIIPIQVIIPDFHQLVNRKCFIVIVRILETLTVVIVFNGS